MRRCGFFLEVFGLTMPDYLQCDIFPESTDTDVCLGNREVADARFRDAMPGNTGVELLLEFTHISREMNAFICIIFMLFFVFFFFITIPLVIFEYGTFDFKKQELSIKLNNS